MFVFSLSSLRSILDFAYIQWPRKLEGTMTGMNKTREILQGNGKRERHLPEGKSHRSRLLLLFVWINFYLSRQANPLGFGQIPWLQLHVIKIIPSQRTQMHFKNFSDHDFDQILKEMSPNDPHWFVMFAKKAKIRYRRISELQKSRKFQRCFVVYKCI